MATLLTAAAAVDALRAAGRTVTRHTRADAAMRHGCPTLTYVVSGRAVTLGQLRTLAAQAAARAARAARVTLPEGLDQAAPFHRFGATSEPAPALATLRADAAAGRPVSLAALARAVAPVPAPATPRGDALAGQPWDPGTPDARARVALQGERVATLWPIAQALRGEGVTLPGSWATDGPVMAGEWPYGRALAALPPGAIAQAAAALAALPPVTAAQDRALALCRSANCEELA
jgi:hypothetical protein